MKILKNLCLKKQLPGFVYKADWEHCGIYWKGTIYFHYIYNNEDYGNIKIMINKYTSDETEVEYLDELAKIPDNQNITFEQRVMLRIAWTFYKAITAHKPEKIKQAFKLMTDQNKFLKVPNECIRISANPPKDFEILWR